MEQIYKEVWKIERDFFYAPNYHGLDLAEAQRPIRPLPGRIASRDDLNYLFREMLSYMSVGHMFVRRRRRARAQDGQGRPAWRRLRDRERPLPFQAHLQRRELESQLHAPLTQPGLNVQEGEYLLAVNGRELLRDE